MKQINKITKTNTQTVGHQFQTYHEINWHCVCVCGVCVCVCVTCDAFFVTMLRMWF